MNGMFNYYQNNNISLPDNKYFKELFSEEQITQKKPSVDPIENTPKGTTVNYKPASYSDSYKSPKTPFSSFVERPGDIKIGSTSYIFSGTVKNSIAQRHNNPGNLMFMGQKNATKGEAKKGGGFWSMFKTMQEGWTALMVDIDNKKKGNTKTGLTGDSTLSDFISVYAPKFENDTTNYVNIITKNLKLPFSTKIKDIDTYTLASAIAQIESGTKVSKK